MHSVTFLKGCDADVLLGMISSADSRATGHQAQSLINMAHSAAFVTIWAGWICCGLGWSAGGGEGVSTFSSGSGERSEVRSGLHELAACQDKHLVIRCWHLLALLSRNFLLDAAQNKEVAQNTKINVGAEKPTVRLRLLPFLRCVQMLFPMSPEFGLLRFGTIF